MVEPVVPHRESLRHLLQVALEEFSGPKQENAERIRAYVSELSLLMDQITGVHAASEDGEPQAERTKLRMSQAAATCQATRDDVVSLVARMEGFLESVLIGSVRPDRSLSNVVKNAVKNAVKGAR